MEFKQINSQNPVIKRTSDHWIYIKDETFTLNDVKDRMKTELGMNSFFPEGEDPDVMPAMILEEGQSWKKGKVRIKVVVEFAEEE